MRAGSFSIQLREATREAAADVVARQNAIIFELGRSFVMDSPVDTGMFRGNWRYSYNSNHMIIDEPDKSGQKSIAALTAFLKGFNGGEMWILNGIKYGTALEYGHSKKAPQGMVRRNIARIKGDA